MSQVIHPSAVAYQDVDLSWLIGRSVTDLYIQGSSFWRLAFGVDASITVECLWRIVGHEGIMRTSEDHGQQFGKPAPVDAAKEATELLSNRQVIAAQLSAGTSDITIEFTGSIKLEIISNSAGYESWQLHDSLGMSYVAQGGGQLYKWKS